MSNKQTKLLVNESYVNGFEQFKQIRTIDLNW